MLIGISSYGTVYNKVKYNLSYQDVLNYQKFLSENIITTGNYKDIYSVSEIVELAGGSLDDVSPYGDKFIGYFFLQKDGDKIKYCADICNEAKNYCSGQGEYIIKKLYDVKTNTACDISVDYTNIRDNKLTIFSKKYDGYKTFKINDSNYLEEDSSSDKFNMGNQVIINEQIYKVMYHEQDKYYLYKTFDNVSFVDIEQILENERKEYFDYVTVLSIDEIADIFGIDLYVDNDIENDDLITKLVEPGTYLLANYDCINSGSIVDKDPVCYTFTYNENSENKNLTFNINANKNSKGKLALVYHINIAKFDIQENNLIYNDSEEAYE